MTKKTMPQDGNGVSVQVLKPVAGSDYELTVTTSAQARTASIAEDVVGIYSDNGAYIKLGDSTVEASASDYDAYIPPEGYREYSMIDVTHISALAVADGTLYVNGLE